jgi:hypothetical protein
VHQPEFGGDIAAEGAIVRREFFGIGGPAFGKCLGVFQP